MVLGENLEVIKEKCVFLFNQHGHHEPMFMLKKKDGIEVVGCLWKGRVDKEYTLQIIKKMIKNKEVEELVFIGEAWVAKSDLKSKEQFESDVQKTLEHDGSLKHYPNRKEALIIQYSSPVREAVFFADIKRNGENVQVGVWECIEESSPSHNLNLKSGNFQNIFTSVMAENN